MTTYKEKLLDPRWQKKRLEILQRDNWTCQRCGETKETLHVHHVHYQGCEPWDTEDKYLRTMCSSCHDYETERMKVVMLELKSSLTKLALDSSDISEIASGFSDYADNLAAFKIERDGAFPVALADMIRDYDDSIADYYKGLEERQIIFDELEIRRLAPGKRLQTVPIKGFEEFGVLTYNSQGFSK